LRAVWDLVAVAILLAGAAGFVYSWFRLLRSYTEKSLRSRDWLSFAAIVLVSAVVILWFVMQATSRHDFGDQVRFADRCAKVSIGICGVAMLAGFLGRPRLVVPVTLACFGVAVFWILSTIP
jgi:hypothetical protein